MIRSKLENKLYDLSNAMQKISHLLYAAKKEKSEIHIDQVEEAHWDACNILKQLIQVINEQQASNKQ